MQDRVIIYGFDFSVFKYNDIESIQMVYNMCSRRNYYVYDVLFFIDNGNRYKAFCCADGYIKLASEKMERIKNIILLKNGKINVMKTKNLTSFEAVPFWWK